MASTTASPCPTSQATTDHPAGGQPGATTCVGTSTTTAPTSAAASNVRVRRTFTNPYTTSSTPVSSSPPCHPANQATDPPGTSDAFRPTVISQPTSGPDSSTSTRAAPWWTGATTAASTPSTVAGATTGAATRLATTDTRLIRPEIATTSGAVTTLAAIGTASASASPIGTPRSRRAAAHRGARSTSAAVATTDNANPGSTPSAGSYRTSTTTVAANAGNADRSRPSTSANNATAPITAARSTLGSGPARTTNPTRATDAPAAHPFGPTRKIRSSNRTAPQRIARFAPLTASRCARPDVRNSSSTLDDTSAVSPTTKAGNRPAGSGSRAVLASRRPDRSTSAARCHTGAGPACDGGPRTRSTATVNSPGRAGARTPRAVTSWPGNRFRHPDTGATSNTSPPSSITEPSCSTEVMSARTTTDWTPP